MSTKAGWDDGILVVSKDMEVPERTSSYCCIISRCLHHRLCHVHHQYQIRFHLCRSYGALLTIVGRSWGYHLVQELSCLACPSRRDKTIRKDHCSTSLMKERRESSEYRTRHQLWVILVILPGSLAPLALRSRYTHRRSQRVTCLKTALRVDSRGGQGSGSE